MDPTKDRSSPARGEGSRLSVAAIALVLAAASFAEARPYILTWDANVDNGITVGYLIFYGTAPGVSGSSNSIDAGSATSFEFDLLPGTTYYFRVRAYNYEDVLGPESTELVFAMPLDAAINVSSTSVGGGGSVTATVVNGPASRFDYVAMNAVGSTAQLDWQYLNGTQSAPDTGVSSAAIAFAMPATSGQYQFRFLANNSTTVLATSATVTVTAGSITPSSTSVTGRSSLTAVVANGAGNRLDWVAVCPPGSVTSGCADWKYLNGTKSAPATGLAGAALTFTMPATSGQYTLKFFLNDTLTLLATSVPVTVTGGSGGSPSITPSSTTLSAGTTMTGTIANGPGNRLDWVAVCPAGSVTTGCTDWKYLNGSRVAPASGLIGAALLFTMPATPGQYTLKFFSNDTMTLLATSMPLTVMGGSGATPSIIPSATTVAAGATVTATIADGAGNRFDWVAVCPPGGVTTGCMNWKYLNGLQVAPVTGLAGAAVTFTMPITAGQYTLKFFLNDTLTMLATSVPMTVTGGVTPSITPAATTVAAGASVGATIANGPGNRLDWVAVCPGASTSGCTDWKYLNGTRAAPAIGLTGAAVTFTMPIAPGQYTLRLFGNDTFAVLATSAMVAVQ